MSKVIEPPVLLSRALAFVLATSVVVLTALVVTLAKMIPLERPEVFFLLTPTRVNNLIIEPMKPDAGNMENYKNGFIRAYVIARNTIKNGPESFITVNNWTNVVKPWSAPNVYKELTDTHLYKQYTLNEQSPAKSCEVSFPSGTKDPAIVPLEKDWYSVKFYLICKEISGQPTQELYKIKIRIQSELDKGISGTLNNLEKLRNNPLGIRVTEYIVQGNTDDPLNADSK